MPGGLDIEPTDEPSGFRVAGDLDVSTAPFLADALDTAVETGGDVVLDLAAVHFVDSTGLQLLMRAARALEGRGRLVLVSPQPRVKLLFDYVLLDRRSNVLITDAHPSADAAAPEQAPGEDGLSAS